MTKLSNDSKIMLTDGITIKIDQFRGNRPRKMPIISSDRSRKVPEDNQNADVLINSVNGENPRSGHLAGVAETLQRTPKLTLSQLLVRRHEEPRHPSHQPLLLAVRVLARRCGAIDESILQSLYFGKFNEM